MLKVLNVENYALIDKLDISFDKGLSIITGETGAGKSIILGALSLIMGNRADGSVLKNKEQNCIVEGHFDIRAYELTELLTANELDYDDELVLRRVINSSGKSRAFINDVPVTLTVLKDICSHLLDIHSQHQNLLLSSASFQLSVLDALAKHPTDLTDYRTQYQLYKDTIRLLDELKAQSAQAKSDYEYTKFQFDQLEATKLKADEQEEWEAEVKQLSHVEDLKTVYEKLVSILSDRDESVIPMLKDASQSIARVGKLMPAATLLAERLETSLIEIRDIAQEVGHINDGLLMDPDRLAFAENRLNTIYDLLKKHHVSTITDLLEIKDQLEQSLLRMDTFDDDFKKFSKQKDAYEKEIARMAQKISKQRHASIPAIEKHIIDMLKMLGMPHVIFKVDFKNIAPGPNGIDEVVFLFSANKDMAPQEISKVASGGEMARLMLALKSLLVQSINLPTIVFDEIDTGISGEVADKMGDIIKQLSDRTQIINITHLPQIAAKGHHHYIVYKHNTSDATFTRMRKLTPEERVEEIAKMLSGSQITEAALQNAKHLLGNS